MKYIRTKNGMLFPTNANEEDIPKDDCFFKVGDTIEELCDEFILHYDHTIQESSCIPWATYERRSENWSKNKEMLVKELNNESGRKAEVYGAIWTNRGLIYVAKMNEKGEFELL